MQPERPEDAGSLDHALSVFVSVRPRLFGIAYRMLGSAADAEDIVQNVWLRWQTTDRSVVSDAPAFLATATARLAINLAQSARSRREAYVGPWLPEPVDTSADPQLGAERGAALEFAILLLLENLSPKERAAYVLREAFNYPYQQIADTLRLSEANVRQLVTRARKHIADGRRTPVSAAEQRRLLVAFIAAAQKGDIAALEGLLASDVVSSADGGGIVRAARVPVVGRAIVAKFIAAIASHFWTGVTLEWIEANAQASVVILRDGAVVGLVTINVGGGHRPDYVGDETEQARGDFILIAGITCAVAAGAPSTSPCRPDFSLSLRESLSQNARASGHSWYLRPIAGSAIGENRSRRAAARPRPRRNHSPQWTGAMGRLFWCSRVAGRNPGPLNESTLGGKHTLSVYRLSHRLITQLNLLG